MTNPAQADAVADLFGIRRPSVLPLDADALTPEVAAGPPVSVPGPPPFVDVDSVRAHPNYPHIGILRTSRITGSEHWAALPESALIVRNPTKPHVGLLPTLSS